MGKPNMGKPKETPQPVVPEPSPKENKEKPKAALSPEQRAERARKRREKEIVDNFKDYFGTAELKQLRDVKSLDTPKSIKAIDALGSKIKDDIGLRAFLDYFGEVRGVDGVNAQIIVQSVKEVFKNNPKEVEHFLNLIREKAKKDKYSIYGVLWNVIDKKMGNFKFDEVIPKE